MKYAAGILSELLSEKKKNIYCFGGGRLFDSFVKEYADFDLEESIKAVVDNNPDLVRVRVKIVNGFFVPLISFDEMIKHINRGDRILITASAYEEIIQQLEKVKKVNDIEFYIYFVLEIDQHDYNRLKIEIPSESLSHGETQIPKIIHYCWFGGKEIPVQYRKWMESWKKYCSDYEIIEWNEKNYDVHKSKYMSQAYERGQWAFVTDYARIDIINQFGGVYLDVDVELIKNIDELLMNQAFCGFENTEYVNYGLGFGAKKNSLILKDVKEYYDNTSFIYGGGILNQTRCPMIQTKIMKRHGLNCNGEFQLVKGMAVYPSRVLCGMSPYSFRVERNPVYTYGIHHFAGSWIQDKKEKNVLISAMRKWSKNDNYIYPDL